MIKTNKVEVNQKDVDNQVYNLNEGIGRYLYNFFINITKERYEKGVPYLSYMKFEKWMNNEYFKEHPEMLWIKKASQKHRKDVLKRVDEAFQRFFKKKGGYPKYKRRRDKVSFYFVNDNHIKLERHKVKIPIFGWLRLKEFGYINNVDVKTIKSGYLVREANKFYICLTVETEEEEIKLLDEPQTEGIGVDLGLNNLAVVSNGMVFENINKNNKYIKILERRKNHLHKELNRRLKKQKTKKERLEKDRKNQKYRELYNSLTKEEKKQLKEKNKLESIDSNLNKKSNIKEEANRKVISKNTLKTINELQKVYSKLERKRSEFVKHVVNSLVRLNPKFITIENINIRGLIKNRHLSKAILNSKWRFFKDYLIKQCKKYNIKVIIADLFYPSTKKCSRCGCKKVKMKLSERTYVCFHCGNEIDRDLNASLNLKYLGLTGEFTPKLYIQVSK